MVIGVWMGQLGVGRFVSYVADALLLRPTGPFFFLFAFFTSAAVPFSGHLWEAATTVLVSVGIVLVVGFSGRVWMTPPEPRQGLSARSGVAHPAKSLKHVGRYVVAVAITGVAVPLLGLRQG